METVVNCICFIVVAKQTVTKEKMAGLVVRDGDALASVYAKSEKNKQKIVLTSFDKEVEFILGTFWKKEKKSINHDSQKL